MWNYCIATNTMQHQNWWNVWRIQHNLLQFVFQMLFTTPWYATITPVTSFSWGKEDIDVNSIQYKDSTPINLHLFHSVTIRVVWKLMQFHNTETLNISDILQMEWTIRLLEIVSEITNETIVEDFTDAIVHHDYWPQGHMIHGRTGFHLCKV